jgi:DNA excision repair protein ERCC-5
LGINEKIALAMLLGGDYTEGVKGVGIVNGMEILQAFPVAGGVKEGLLAFRHWLDGNDFLLQSENLPSTMVEAFHNKHKSARLRWVVPKDFPSNKVFQAYSQPVVDTSKQKFTFGLPDDERIRLFCRHKIGWDTAETDRALIPVLEKIKNRSRQTRLDGYFMRYEDNHSISHQIKSKRLREVFGSTAK